MNDCTDELRDERNVFITRTVQKPPMNIKMS